jgi:hypothetical protein
VGLVINTIVGADSSILVFLDASESKEEEEQ